MTRRAFLKALAGFLGLITLPTLHAAPTPRRLIQNCPLAGFEHHDGPDLWPYLTVCDSLELIREPGNPHDPHAIRVDWLGRKIGYIPRSQNQAAARLIDQGRTVEARIGGLKGHANPWYRVSVEVWRVG